MNILLNRKRLPNIYRSGKQTVTKTHGHRLRMLKETALLFTNRCMLKNETITDEVYRKHFSDRKFGTTEIWNWIYIYDSVSFYDERRRELCLYNRIGYDQVTTKLYTDTIRYLGGGKVETFLY